MKGKRPTRAVTRRGKLRAQLGGAFFDSVMSGIKSALGELKRGKYISKLGKAYGTSGLPYSGAAGIVGNIADKFGYGKKKKVGRPKKGAGYQMEGRGKKKCGGALAPAGAGIRLAGAGRKKKGGALKPIAKGNRIKKQTVFP